jgi:hypothetical protein
MFTVTPHYQIMVQLDLKDLSRIFKRKLYNLVFFTFNTSYIYMSEYLI